MDQETEEQQSANFFKIVRLLVDIGADALRYAFLKEIPSNKLASELQLNFSKFMSLKKKKVLTEPQFDLLQESPPDPSKFDISLLVALLRNICPNIEKPKYGWSVKIPDEKDKSLGAELLRIRNIRNKHLHPSSTLMPEQLFKPLWTDLVAIITRIAVSVNNEVTGQIIKKISLLEQRDIDPAGEEEKKIFQIFQNWQMQIADILFEEIDSVKNSLGSLHLKAESVLDSVDAVRVKEDSSHEMLREIQEKVTQLSQDVHNISNQAAGGEHSKIQPPASDIEQIKEQLQYLLQEVATVKQHMQRWPASKPWENPDSQFQNEELGDGFENASDLSDRDIDTIARKVGLEWERMATFLDYGEGQKGSLKTIYKDKPVTLIYQMIKRWSVVVTQCKESPRKLLAAAFAEIDNHEMAQELVKAEDMEGIKNLQAGPATKKKIKQIVFENLVQGI